MKGGDIICRGISLSGWLNQLHPLAQDKISSKKRTQCTPKYFPLLWYLWRKLARKNHVMRFRVWDEKEVSGPSACYWSSSSGCGIPVWDISTCPPAHLTPSIYNTHQTTIGFDLMKQRIRVAIWFVRARLRKPGTICIEDGHLRKQFFLTTAYSSVLFWQMIFSINAGCSEAERMAKGTHSKVISFLGLWRPLKDKS